MAIIHWRPADELTSRRHWVPAIDLLETDDHLLLRADLPGLSEEDVSIEIAGDVLTLSGERRSEREERTEDCRRVERTSGWFSRSLSLPEGVDAEAVKATFACGVLEVRIPKPEQRRPRRVPISAGHTRRDATDGTSGRHVRRRPRVPRLLQHLRR